MASSELSQFSGQKYLSLETFRKNGVGVKTPLWFAASADPVQDPNVIFYVYTLPDAGKIKRIRNNPHVRIAQCTATGRITGEWVDAEATFAASPEAENGQDLLRKKYFPLKGIGEWFSRLRGRTQTVIAIRPNLQPSKGSPE
jgi:uncharacterized protein